MLSFSEEKPAAIAWQDAREHYNEVVKITGEIINTYKTENFCFMNFDTDYKNSFTIVIPSRAFNKFPVPIEESYKNKKIIVYGRIVKFQNKPEIIVTDPTQIKLLDE